MNNLILNNATMSSLEIAELTGKRHNHVLRDIENVLDEVGIGASKFGSSYLSSQNKQLPCYNLPRRECDLVVSGYVAKYRLAIIDRWQELENAQPKIPQTFAEALRLAADTQEALDERNSQLAIANIRQISEPNIPLENFVIDVRNQHPEIDISYRGLLKLLRDHKVIRKYSTLPLLKQNPAVPFRLRSGGDGHGNRITYVSKSDKDVFVGWYLGITCQSIDDNKF